MTILDTKNYISRNTDIKYKFYDNDKYIGIILENKSDLNKFIKFLNYQIYLIKFFLLVRFLTKKFFS